jgi:uncharacterized protein
MIHCKECKGDCCKYIAIEIDEPDTIEDFDEIRWFLAHKNVRVYKDNEGDWLVEFITPCKYLCEDTNSCKIYDKRPAICVDHGVDECSKNGDGEVEDILFETVEQVEEYMVKRFGDITFPISKK